MPYTPTPKKKTVTITPHIYRVGPFSHYNAKLGTEVQVFVIKGDEHPDPSRRLTWAIASDGSQVPGDYNDFFTKSGKPIHLEVDITEAWTAHQEKELEMKAIYDYLGGLVK